MTDEWYEFARITDESGYFNEDCEVSDAKAMLAAGLLSSFDGTDDHGYCVEHFYTVLEKNEDAVLVWLRNVDGSDAEEQA
jgi:hypothetical protein